MVFRANVALDEIIPRPNLYANIDENQRKMTRKAEHEKAIKVRLSKMAG